MHYSNSIRRASLSTTLSLFLSCRFALGGFMSWVTVITKSFNNRRIRENLHIFNGELRTCLAQLLEVFLHQIQLLCSGASQTVKEKTDSAPGPEEAFVPNVLGAKSIVLLAPCGSSHTIRFWPTSLPLYFIEITGDLPLSSPTPPRYFARTRSQTKKKERERRHWRSCPIPFPGATRAQSRSQTPVMGGSGPLHLH